MSMLLSHLIQLLLGVMPMQDGADWYVIVALPWQLPSSRTTHTWTVPLLSWPGMWKVRLEPVLPQTGDLCRQRVKEM